MKIINDIFYCMFKVPYESVMHACDKYILATSILFVKLLIWPIF